MTSKKLKANNAGYYIYNWFDDVYYVADVWKGIEYVTRQPRLFYTRKAEVTINPVLRKEPDLDALVVAIMHMLDEDSKRDKSSNK